MIDFSINRNKGVLNNDIDLIKQQIDILFDTIVMYLIIEIVMHLLIVLKRIQQIFFITFED